MDTKRMLEIAKEMGIEVRDGYDGHWVTHENGVEIPVVPKLLLGEVDQLRHLYESCVGNLFVEETDLEDLDWEEVKCPRCGDYDDYIGSFNNVYELTKILRKEGYDDKFIYEFANEVF